MEMCSFQVIYLLCLMSTGAGRDVNGEGEVREIGSSGVISGGGDGRGLRGPLSTASPSRPCQRWAGDAQTSRGAALLGQIIAIVAVAWRPSAFWAGPGEQPFVSHPCLCPESHLSPGGCGVGRQGAAETHFHSLPMSGSCLVACARAGRSPGPCFWFSPCSVYVGDSAMSMDRTTGRAVALTFAFLPLPQQLKIEP